MMFYHCDSRFCHYTFFGKVRLCHCPDCGGVHIRPATQSEISDYRNEHPDRSTEKAG